MAKEKSSKPTSDWFYLAAISGFIGLFTILFSWVAYNVTPNEPNAALRSSLESFFAVCRIRGVHKENMQIKNMGFEVETGWYTLVNVDTGKRLDPNMACNQVIHASIVPKNPALNTYTFDGSTGRKSCAGCKGGEWGD